ncbi:hypothetical protein T440DRAFT_39897 [Plenodomus tracheiphilus IPT5]|uniref:Uncharacterized protein n=1 Tax=Plenodomus tracheiphilus IPT5 TaxID=1408161 RepID=A0A6A7B9Y6_9PLEO|nr:hypothetical protein T440DRAFT_39897 [Plenodomus tracheiphilus IPT5]
MNMAIQKPHIPPFNNSLTKPQYISSQTIKEKKYLHSLDPSAIQIHQKHHVHHTSQHPTYHQHHSSPPQQASPFIT